MIIGLIGKKQSGKDTFCSVLSEKTPIRRIAFADELKHEVAVACGTTVRFIDEHKDAFRLILQGWGADYKRNLISKDYWILRLKPFSSERTNIVTDCRFLNEVDHVKKNGGVIVRIERNNITSDNHVSENETDCVEPDFTVFNTGTLQEFRDRCLKIYDAILLRQ